MTLPGYTGAKIGRGGRLALRLPPLCCITQRNAGRRSHPSAVHEAVHIDMKIIAEIGVNHDGDVARALALVESCKRLGADYAKFQVFDSSKLVTKDAKRAAYQAEALGEGTQQDMLRKLELGNDDFRRIHAHCEKIGIAFLATPFDLDAARFLIDDLGCGTVKVGSGDLDNLPLLLTIASRGVDMIVSTGMSDYDEVTLSVGAIAYGRMMHARGEKFGLESRFPGTEDMRQALAAGAPSGLTLLHCTSEYPATHPTLNMRAITAMREMFAPIPIGFSDHSTDDVAAIMAVCFGAVMIERHITYDRTAVGPDHAASLDEPAFARMIEAIRTAEAALGFAEGRKVMSSGEKAIRGIARKRLVAGRDLKAGETLTLANTLLKRAPDGIAAGRIGEVLGKELAADASQDTPIVEGMLR